MPIPSPDGFPPLSTTQWAIWILIWASIVIAVGLAGRRWARRGQRERELMLAFLWGFIVTAVFTRYIGPWLMWLTMHAVHGLVP